MNKKIIGTSLLAGLLMLSQPVLSAPALINYQGVLTNMSGKAVTGPVTMIFKIWDSETIGTSSWTETHTGVKLQDGVYNVILGSVDTDTLIPGKFANDESWLEVTVNGEVLAPRQQITSVAYAHNADTLDGLDSASFTTNTDLQTTGSSSVHWGNLTNVPAGLNDGDTDTHGTDMWTDGTGQVTTTGNVGIGTTSPGQQLSIVGQMSVTDNLRFGGDSAGQFINGVGSTLNFYTNYLPKMTIDNSGNVGIGTTTPASGLHIKGPDFPDSFMYIDTDSANQDAGIRLYENDVAKWHLYNNGDVLDKLRLAPESNSISGGITILQDGNVGIGTTTPSYPLDVVSSDNNSIYALNSNPSGHAVHGHASATIGTTYGGYFTSSSPTGRGLWGSANYTSGINYGVYGRTYSPDGYAGYFNGGRNFFGGNVGIGVTDPAVKLELGGAGAKIRIHESGQSPYVEIGDDSTDKGYLQWYSPADSLYLYTSGHAYPIRIGPWGSGGLFVDTEANGGKVGVGTIAPSHLLHVAGVARSTSSAWATSSDERVKEDVEPLSGSLSLLGQLHPVSYEYTEEYQDGNKAIAGKRLGFIAQEVEKVFPNMVTTISEQVGEETIDDFRLLNTDGMMPLMVDAIQELEKENKMLKSLICLDHTDAAICQE